MQRFGFAPSAFSSFLLSFTHRTPLSHDHSSSWRLHRWKSAHGPLINNGDTPPNSRMPSCRERWTGRRFKQMSAQSNIQMWRVAMQAFAPLFPKVGEFVQQWTCDCAGHTRGEFLQFEASLCNSRRVLAIPGEFVQFDTSTPVTSHTPPNQHRSSVNDMTRVNVEWQ